METDAEANLVDELQKQLAEMSSKLDQANWRVENIEAEGAQEVTALKREMKRKLNEYEEGKKRDHAKYVETLGEIEQVKENLEIAESNGAEGMSQKLREACEEVEHLRERNEELMRMLNESGALLQLQQPQLQRPAAVLQEQPIQPSQLHPDIFQMFKEKTDETMSMTVATCSLRSMLFADKQWRVEYVKAMEGEDMMHTLDCNTCKESFANYEIVDHFLSLGHVQKIRDGGAYFVSRGAVEYWERKLQSIPAPIAVAASAASSES